MHQLHMQCCVLGTLCAVHASSVCVCGRVHVCERASVHSFIYLQGITVPRTGQLRIDYIWFAVALEYDIEDMCEMRMCSHFVAAEVIWMELMPCERKCRFWWLLGACRPQLLDVKQIKLTHFALLSSEPIIYEGSFKMYIQCENLHCQL